MELRQAALTALRVQEPAAKLRATRWIWDERASLEVHVDLALAEPAGLPGRPDRPALVPPARVARRALGTAEGRCALMHAVAHIEFNAINLALDACWRFAGMPEGFYLDWLRVAAEEAHHFQLVEAHLQSLGSHYGAFDAHDGLWQMATKTKGDVLARMALVPRILEARGLDVTPSIQQKLGQAGDHNAVAILDVILHDEVGHVAIGNHWFHRLCEQRGLEPVAEMASLMQKYAAPRPRPPFNLDARQRAGFTDPELAALQRPVDHPRG